MSNIILIGSLEFGTDEDQNEYVITREMVDRRGKSDQYSVSLSLLDKSVRYMLTCVLVTTTGRVIVKFLSVNQKILLGTTFSTQYYTTSIRFVFVNLR